MILVLDRERKEWADRLFLLRTTDGTDRAAEPFPWQSRDHRRPEGNDVSDHEAPSGASPVTPAGRLIGAAGSLGGPPGWRGRAGRTVAYAALVAAALAVVALVGSIIWRSV
jgi:hypothetical protein